MRRQKRLVPDSRGILTPAKPVIRHSGSVTPYTKPNPTIHRIDRLRKGVLPEICFTRKQGGIGDVLMTLPTIKAVSTKYGIQVDYGTDFEYLGGALPKVLQGNPYIRNVIPWQEIDPDQYDALVDLTCPCISHEIPRAEPINRIDLFARYTGVQLVNYDIDYQITQEELEWAEEYIVSRGLNLFKLILVQASASNVARDYPIDRMKRALVAITASRPDIRILVLTHSSDHTKVGWGDIAHIHTLDDMDVRQIAAIMKFTNLVICPDSAVLHVAAALHHPTLTLFGPTDPRARVNYHPEAVAIWPAQHLQQYPVWYIDPRDGYLCWKMLEEGHVARTAIAMVDKAPLPVSRDYITFGDYSTHNEYYEIV